METTFDNMSIIRRYINATDGFDHAAERADGLNQKKCAVRGDRQALYLYAVQMLQPEYDGHYKEQVDTAMKNLFGDIRECFKIRKP